MFSCIVFVLNFVLSAVDCSGEDLLSVGFGWRGVGSGEQLLYHFFFADLVFS